jgi:hypothetical protein
MKKLKNVVFFVLPILKSFIKNLCENEFAEKLAQSINERNVKKLNESILSASESTATMVNYSSPMKTSTQQQHQPPAPFVLLSSQFEAAGQAMVTQIETAPQCLTNSSRETGKESENGYIKINVEPTNDLGELAGGGGDQNGPPDEEYDTDVSVFNEKKVLGLFLDCCC